MSSSRLPFQPSSSQSTTVVRSLVGLIVSLAFLIGSLALLLIKPISFKTDFQSGFDVPGLYLSVVRGSFVSSEDGENWRRVQEGQDLVPGNLFRTRAGSVALLRSSGRELQIAVFPGSSLSVGGDLDKADLSLYSGEIHVRANSSGHGDTVFDIGDLMLADLTGFCSLSITSGEESTQIQVFRGTVDLSFKDKELDNQDTQLKDGDIAKFQDKELQVTSQVYLPAPKLTLPVNGAVLRKERGSAMPIDLQWDEVDQADSYEVEIAQDILFQSSLVKRTTSEPQFTIGDLSQGRYYWQVTPIGSHGERGETSVASPFNVVFVDNPEEETLSAPNLSIKDVLPLGQIVSIQGQTEVGAHVEVYLESFGVALTDPREILVNPDGSFRVQLEAPERGELQVVIRAYYRPKIFTQRTGTVFVDF